MDQVNALMVRENELSIIDSLPASIEALKVQLGAIERIHKEVMVKDVDYGVIPGCSLPSLYQPGAELLGIIFRLIPRYKNVLEWLPLGHLFVQSTCELYSANGAFVGEATASATTMETKHRWRKKFTEEDVGEVPRTYWNVPKEASLERNAVLVKLYGEGKYRTKKTGDGWRVFKITGDSEERQENPDIADTTNTVIQIAQKRAYVRAMRNRTGASRFFTQDIEEFPSFADASKAAEVEAAKEKAEEKAAVKEEKLKEAEEKRKSKVTERRQTEGQPPKEPSRPEPKLPPKAPIDADPESPEGAAMFTLLSMGSHRGEPIGEQATPHLQNYLKNYRSKLSSNEVTAIQTVIQARKQDREGPPPAAAKKVEDMRLEELEEFKMPEGTRKEGSRLAELSTAYLAGFADKFRTHPDLANFIPVLDRVVELRAELPETDGLASDHIPAFERPAEEDDGKEWKYGEAEPEK